MEENKSESMGVWKFVACFCGVLCLVLTSVLIALFMSRNYYSSACATNLPQIQSTPTSNFLFTKKTEWSPVETIRIAEKGVKIVRTYNSDRCYIMPLQQSEESDIARPMILVPGKLSLEVIEQVAGEEAAEFCQDLDTYLLREPEKEIAREKRQAGGAWRSGPNPAQQAQAAAAAKNQDAAGSSGGAGAGEPAHWRQQTSLARAGLQEVPGGELEFGRGGAPKQGEPGWRPSGLDFPYDQRVPRCMDLVLDCGKPGAVGEVQECFTWVNGVIKMAQRCVAPNKFEIFMTKPPGRILKVAQKQWILCIQRRKQGFRC